MFKAVLASLLNFLVLTLAARCDAQQPPAPYYACPPVQLGPKNNAKNYSALNRSAPVPATTYTDLDSKKNRIVPGAWCYIVQAQRNGHRSLPSNTTIATLKQGNHKVVLNWNAPANCAGCTYILSRIAAAAAPAPMKGNSNKSAPAALVK
jgi:hypothetical protein